MRYIMTFTKEEMNRYIDGILLSKSRYLKFY